MVFLCWHAMFYRTHILHDEGFWGPSRKSLSYVPPLFLFQGRRDVRDARNNEAHGGMNKAAGLCAPAIPWPAGPPDSRSWKDCAMNRQRTAL
jgi:hypothetical protein